MPTNKNAAIRYQALDKCFRDRRHRYYIEDLIDACNEALLYYNGAGGVSRRQIFEDIKFMESDTGWSIPLERKKDGKKVYYLYYDSDFSINQQPLTDEEAQQLQTVILTLGRFRGLPTNEWVEEVISNLEWRFNLKGKKDNIIGFEQNPNLKGLEYLSDIKIIVEKFRQVTLAAIGGEAKAMLVTSSRAHALRYYMQIKQYCAEKGYQDVHPMVAFSGKVKWNGEAYLFCDLLYRLLPVKRQDKVDLNKQIELVNSRIEEGDMLKITLEKGKGGIKGENVKGGKKKDENRDLLSNIIEKVNLMYKGNFSPQDRVIVEAIFDKLSTAANKRKLAKQTKNNDPKQFAESIFPDIFEKAAQQCYNDSVGAFDRLFQNKELYNSIMTQMADQMYQNYRVQGDALIFNPERFKKKIMPTIEQVFSVFKTRPKQYAQIADDLVTIIAAKTTDSIDGANDVIQNAFNHLFCSPVPLPLVELKQHFDTLVSRFEVFLKKVYYLRNHEEIVSTRPGQEGAKATLADCIFQTPCLKRLKYSTDPTDKLFAGYLDKVREWRNDNAHKALTSTAEECIKSINVLTAMYLYVVALGIRTSELHTIVAEMSPQHDDMLMAAKERSDSE